MSKQIYKTVTVILLAGFVYSCAGTTGSLENVAPDLNLRVLDETYVDGGTVGKAALNIQPSETGYSVDVTVNDAQNLKALFFELDYDCELWHPVGCKSTGLLDIEATPIDVSHLSDPGTVSHGQVVQHYDKHSGFSGDGVLARVEFASGAAPEGRKTSTLGTPYSATPTVMADYYNKFLRVYYNIRGDYDNNGEVNIADIMPLSLFFNSGYSDDHIHFTNDDGTVNDTIFTSPSFYVDGNSDGEINLADLSTIAMNYGFSISGFDICASPDYLGDYPFDGSMTDSAAVVGTFNLPASNGYDREDRGYWDFPLPTMNYANHYWVHPVSGNESGKASMVALDLGDYPASIDKEYGLQYDPELNNLNWTANLRGDMDSNAEANLGDITQVGMKYGTVGPFQKSSIEWAVDSTRNGVIDFADLALLENLFNIQENYRVYATIDSLLVPQSPLDTQSIQYYSQSTGLELMLDRPDFSERSRVVVPATFESGTYVWVRMYNVGGDEGPRSEVIQIP